VNLRVSIEVYRLSPLSANDLVEPDRPAQSRMACARPAPMHGSDSVAKQASTRSQAAASIRNSVAVTTGRTWVFSRPD
jgi:hypothetical protein